MSSSLTTLTALTYVGMPPVWKPLTSARQLPEDAGEYFRDQNSARFPKYPMEPAVRALLTQNTGSSASNINIFACGSTLGNLLRFVRKADKPFRFTVEAVGNTIFFVRRENAPDERIIGVRGYGHTFPEAYTQWHDEVKNSASHQRLIQYTFAGLNCVVRFEGDGYLKHLAGEDVCETISLDLPVVDGLVIQQGGRGIAQESVFDLKTRSVKRKLDDILTEELPRLWVTQIPNFVLAFHEHGTFTKDDISIRDVRKEVGDWEKQNQGDLRMLGKLMNKLVDLVKGVPGRRCEVRCLEIGMLEIHRQLDDAPLAMSPDLHLAWTHMKFASDSDDDGPLGGARLSSSDGGESDDEDSIRGVDLASFSDEDSGPDFTACSAACGYCGRC